MLVLILVLVLVLVFDLGVWPSITPTSPATSTPKSNATDRSVRPTRRDELIQEVLPVQRVALRGTKSRVANNPAQLFFGRAVGNPGSAHHVLLQHHRSHVVPAE